MFCFHSFLTFDMIREDWIYLQSVRRCKFSPWMAQSVFDCDISLVNWYNRKRRTNLLVPKRLTNLKSIQSTMMWTEPCAESLMKGQKEKISIFHWFSSGCHLIAKHQDVIEEIPFLHNHFSFSLSLNIIQSNSRWIKVEAMASMSSHYPSHGTTYLYVRTFDRILARHRISEPNDVIITLNFLNHYFARFVHAAMVWLRVDSLDRNLHNLFFSNESERSE